MSRPSVRSKRTGLGQRNKATCEMDAGGFALWQVSEYNGYLEENRIPLRTVMLIIADIGERQ